VVTEGTGTVQVYIVVGLELIGHFDDVHYTHPALIAISSFYSFPKEIQIQNSK